MAGPLQNALQNYLTSENQGRQKRAYQQQQQQQTQSRAMLGQMLSGGDSGNLAQIDPQSYMKGQEFMQNQQAIQQKAQQQAQEQEQQKAFMNDMFESAKTGDFVGLSEQYPQYSQEIQEASKNRDEMISSGLGNVSAKVYNALDRGDTKDVFEILENNKDKLDAYGSATFNYEDARQLAISDPEKLKQMALQTVRLSGVDLGDPSSKPMTEYQMNQIALRRLENQTRQAQNKINNESNEIKKQRMQADLNLKEQKLATMQTNVALDQTERFNSAKLVNEEGQRTLDLVNAIEGHEGFSSAIGAKGVSSGFGLLDKPIAGTAAADVVAMLDSLEAKNFLTSIKSFKAAGGAGALSDAEGAKLSAAMSSLKRDQSEPNLKKQFKVIRDIVKKQMIQAGKEQTKYQPNKPKQQQTQKQYTVGQVAQHPDGRTLIFTDQGWQAK